MSSPLATIKVRHPNDPNVMMLINESDLADHHVRWDDEHASQNDEMRVGKGPRGKWYVKRGKENIEGPFDTEAEASVALGEGNAGQQLLEQHNRLPEAE